MTGENHDQLAGTGYLTRRLRTLFWGVAMLPGVFMIGSSMIMRGQGLGRALLLSLVSFLFLLGTLLFLGRMVELVREKAWRPVFAAWRQAPKRVRWSVGLIYGMALFAPPMSAVLENLWFGSALMWQPLVLTMLLRFILCFIATVALRRQFADYLNGTKKYGQ